MRSLIKNPNKNARSRIITLISLSIISSFGYAEWWNPFAPSDYEECIHEAGKEASTDKALEILTKNCADLFLGRRNKSGSGYVYLEPSIGQLFEIEDSNPNEDEWAKIAKEVAAVRLLREEEAEKSRIKRAKQVEEEREAAKLARQERAKKAEVAKKERLARVKELEEERERKAKAEAERLKREADEQRFCELKRKSILDENERIRNRETRRVKVDVSGSCWIGCSFTVYIDNRSNFDVLATEIDYGFYPGKICPDINSKSIISILKVPAGLTGTDELSTYGGGSREGQKGFCFNAKVVLDTSKLIPPACE